MASRNADSVAHQQGGFHARKPRSEPQDQSFVKPGNERGNAAAPEFHAETHSPGAAPQSASFRPNPVSGVPGQALNPDMMDSEYRTDPLSTMPGATSGDLHNATDEQHGRPMIGQTLREQHGAHGVGKRKGERSGLQGVGASAAQGTVEGKARATAADREEARKGLRGATGAEEGGYDWPGAENMENVHAEEVASEAGPRRVR